MKATLTVKGVQGELAANGVAFRSLPESGEFRVVVMGKAEIQAYYTDELGDALSTGKAMAGKSGCAMSEAKLSMRGMFGSTRERRHAMSEAANSPSDADKVKLQRDGLHSICASTCLPSAWSEGMTELQWYRKQLRECQDTARETLGATK